MNWDRVATDLQRQSELAHKYCRQARYYGASKQDTAPDKTAAIVLSGLAQALQRGMMSNHQYMKAGEADAQLSGKEALAEELVNVPAGGEEPGP